MTHLEISVTIAQRRPQEFLDYRSVNEIFFFLFKKLISKECHRIERLRMS